MGTISKIISCSLAVALTTSSFAYADVRRTDEIVGETMAERGISASLCPSIDANRAVLVDADGKTYFARSASDECNIASITKIMTAAVAMDNAPLTTVVTVNDEAGDVGESSAGLWVGDKLDLRNALIGLMVPSGNDAAIAIAEGVGELILKDALANGETPQTPGGNPINTSDENAAYQTFVWAMNKKAAELGCTNTVFLNAHGLDDGEFSGNLHSSAADVAKIVSYAMKNTLFREIVKMEKAKLEVDRSGDKIEVEVNTTDVLLGNFDGACGVKTGFTDKAGYCFAGACERDGESLYAIILDSTSDAQRFVDAQTLFEWVYSNEVEYPLAHSNSKTLMEYYGTTAEVPIVAEVALSAWPDKTVPGTFAGDPSVKVFALNGNISQDIELYDVPGSVSVGDKIGHAIFYQRNEVIAEADIVACEDVPAPDFFQSIGIIWQRFLGIFTGAPSQADSLVLNETPLIIEKD